MFTDGHPASLAGSPWFIRYKRNPDPSVRLLCFHCAGGSASEFRNWPDHLPGRFELLAIQLPGREGRVKEPFLANMPQLAGGVVDAITPFLDRPYVVFGHSFGALCGFEVIRETRRRGLPQPLLFVPAGRRAAHLQSRRPPIASLPMDEFVRELQKDYGDHMGHILRSAELREVFVPQIHADFALSEAHHCEPEPPLDCPIVGFGGIDEHELEAQELEAWRAHSRRGFRAQRFPGDHFFIRQSQRPLLEAITREITSLRREWLPLSHLVPA